MNKSNYVKQHPPDNIDNKSGIIKPAKMLSKEAAGTSPSPKPANVKAKPGKMGPPQPDRAILWQEGLRWIQNFLNLLNM